MHGMSNVADKQRILIFIAQLAWADGKIEPEEVAHILQFRITNNLPPATDSDLLRALAHRYSHDEIAREYQKLLAITGFGETAKEDLARQIFDILAADHTVNTSEIEIVKRLRTLDANPTAVKRIIFSPDSPPELK